MAIEAPLAARRARRWPAAWPPLRRSSSSLRAVQDHPNPTIAALLFLLVVLATATRSHTCEWRSRISVAAMLAFNFFLLPPFHTLTIADPQNWVALFVFVVVAIIASQLSAAVRQRASEAEARKQEVTRLFDLSRDILLTTDSERAIADVARYVARRFELEAIAICLPTADGWEVHQGGERSVEPSREQLDHALARLRGPLEYDARQRAYGGHVEVGDRATSGRRWCRCDSARSPSGSWRPSRAELDLGTLDALGGVVAIAIERAHFLAERKKAETLSQRADLASALLASFSHDLRTPVTSVRVAVTNLQDVALPPDERRAQAQLALQELDRLTRLFQDILDMARIDAAAVNPGAAVGLARRTSSTPPSLTSAPALAGHTLEIDADGADRDPGRSALDVHRARARAGERRHGTRRTARRSPFAPGPRATARISSCGITGPGSTHPTWITCSSRSIAARRPGTPPAQAWGSRSRAGCWRPKAAASGARTCPDGGAQFTIMVPISRARHSDAQRLRSHAVTRPDRGR